MAIKEHALVRPKTYVKGDINPGIIFTQIIFMTSQRTILLTVVSYQIEIFNVEVRAALHAPSSLRNLKEDGETARQLSF